MNTVKAKKSVQLELAFVLGKTLIGWEEDQDFGLLRYLSYPASTSYEVDGSRRTSSLEYRAPTVVPY